jgi:pyrroline-5-carboxylate reductase
MVLEAQEAQMDKIGFIGGGNMAEAMIKGIIAAKAYPPENVFVSDIRTQRLEYLAGEYHIKTAADNMSLAAEMDILVLSVKPQNMAEVLAGIKDSLNRDALIISIAAGIRTEKISGVFGQMPIVRVMPNTPALIGQGASALYANVLAKPLLRKAETIFASVGLAVFVEDEDLIDAVTAVSGSGPAYYFLLMEEMTKAATALGLEEGVAAELVLQTAKGAALLAKEAQKRGETPAQLRKKVTSPGGTTEAALKVFAEGGFGPLVEVALKRACERSKGLSK